MSSRHSSHPYHRERDGDRFDNKRKTHSGFGPMKDYNSSARGEKTKERPTRTLFVRNVSYEVSEKHLREIMESHGELKKFFNLIEKRGMAFVTYWDLRASESAKKALQGMELYGRPVKHFSPFCCIPTLQFKIDVHYALPKDEELEKSDEVNTGTLFLTLRGYQTPPSLHDIRELFKKWGDLKDVRDCKNSPNQKFVEYYDLRDSEKAHDEANNMNFMGGYLDIKYAYVQISREEKRARDDKLKTPRSGSDYSNESQNNFAPPSTSNFLPPHKLSNFSSVDPQRLVIDQMQQLTNTLQNQSNYHLSHSSSQSSLTPTQVHVNPAHLGISTSLPSLQSSVSSSIPSLPSVPSLQSSVSSVSSVPSLPTGQIELQRLVNILLHQQSAQGGAQGLQQPLQNLLPPQGGLPNLTQNLSNPYPTNFNQNNY